MPDTQTIGVFIVAAVALLVVPGPAVFYLVTQSIGSGRRGGMAAMLGIQTAGAVHVAAAAAGVSAVLVSSAVAFSILKYAGAVYLVWLGIRRLIHRQSLVDDAMRRHARTGAQLYRQGFLVNLLNPKAALFFVAVLPQFIDPDAGAAWSQVLVLGAIFLAVAVVTDTVWVLASGWVARRVQTPRAQKVERVISAAVLVALGVAAALQRPATS